MKEGQGRVFESEIKMVTCGLYKYTCGYTIVCTTNEERIKSGKLETPTSEGIQESDSAAPAIWPFFLRDGGPRVMY